MIDNVVAALGLGLNLTDEEIADVLWLAVQMQQFGDGVISEQDDRNEALGNSVSNRENPKQPAQSLRNDDRDRQDENKKDEQNFEVHSKNAQGDDRSTRRSDELQLKIPDARSLQEPLELARSLRPLMRRVPSQVNTLLDEEATVHRIAEEKIWCPVLRPALEPWLDLALVIDDSASMLMWRHTIAELQHFLSSYGVFRDVRVWRLGTDKAEKVCIYAGATASDRNGSPRSPSELIEANGRGLVLVVSDCIAPIWRNGAIASALQIWSRSGMVAILQMLPDWLWARTALGRGVAAQFSALAAGIPNYQLTTTTVSTWYDIDLATSIKIPVVTLEPEKFTAWAEMLAGKGGAWSAGIVFEPDLFSVPEVAIELDGASELDAEERVQSFRLTASPIARRLAGLLAAAPVISLPIVRILQSKVLTQSQPVHVAEVFLGGLLKPLSEITAKTNPNYVQYDFIEGVRDLLLESVPSSEIINVVAEVSEFVAERLGISLDEFSAVIRTPQQVQNTELANRTKPFALLTAQILKRLGGEYVGFAEEVEQANATPVQKPSINVSTSHEKYIYQVGGTLRLDVSSYVTRDCDRELYESLKAGEFCYVLSSRMMGKSSLMVRTLVRLQEDGIKGVILDFSQNNSQSDRPDLWYNGIIRQLNYLFELLDREDFLQWLKERDFLSPVQRLGEFIETVLLSGIEQPIVIFIDEIDSTFGLPFTDDFFALIRACYNKRPEKPAYQRLTFALLGVAAPSDLIRDVKRTPFNISKGIDLMGFTLDEAQPLAIGLAGIADDPQAVLRSILHWTGGQPFLSQRLCQFVVDSAIYIDLGDEASVIEGLVHSRLIDQWESQDQLAHLKTISRHVLDDEQKARYLLELYRLIRQAGTLNAYNRPEERDLQLSGLVVKRDGKLQVYNPIYEAVFDEAWIDGELAKLRPYSDSFGAWIASGKSDVSLLLRGEALREAEQWADEKNSSAEDREFLFESRMQERRKEITAKKREALVEQAKKAEEIPPPIAGEAIFMGDRRIILILSANPKGTSPLRLSEEVREIKEGLKRSNCRDLYQVETAEVVRVRDIQRAMLDHKPNIVHFCGHGTGEEGLVFEHETGQVELVSAEALAGLFATFADKLDCVLLNACYSEVQAKAIAQHINHVIAMSQAIGDRAAMSFAMSFYDALGANKGIDFAYTLGCNAILMQGIPEQVTPILFTKANEIGEQVKTMPSQRVFISYRSQEPDVSLAQEFHDQLQAAGHELFMAAKSIDWGENWVARIDQELKQCDYFLLLLSEQSASSDMVAGEVRTARRLRDKLGKPIILPIRVNLPVDDPLNYELRSVLQTIQQKTWRSPADTPILIEEILALLSTRAAPEPIALENISIAPPITPRRPPLPVADLELPGGCMPLASVFYVEIEPWDRRCCQEITKKAGLVRIKAPRQMGKTSLLARLRNHAAEQGYRTVVLDFLDTDEATFESSSFFLKRFCVLVSRQLEVSPRKVTEFWDEELFGPKENCSDYIEQYVLADLTTPLFLGIDEVDRLFPYGQVAKEFLMLLRAWNEKARVNKNWAKLRMAIAHSTESYVVMDINSSPFNVGLAVDLPEFTSAQVLDLALRHGLRWDRGEVEQLIAVVGGHPYLIRLALYHVAQQHLMLAELLAEAPTDAGIFGDHLRRHLWNLQQHPELAQAFRQVILSDRAVILEPMLAFKLNGMGLVDLQGKGAILRHDRLYRPYFHSRLSLRP